MLILRDFAFYDEVAVASYLLELGLPGKLVFQFVVEDSSHGSPYKGGAVGKLGYLYGLRLGVVDVGAIEPIACLKQSEVEGASREGGEHDYHRGNNTSLFLNRVHTV